MTPCPALFLGHGNPFNAIQGNCFSRAWALPLTIPTPEHYLLRVYLCALRRADELRMNCG